MRLNRGTLILVAAALIVIVGVLVLNSQQAAAPGDPTPAATVAGAGPILNTVTAEAVTAVQVRDNVSGAYTALARNPAGEWVIAATNRTDRAVDQARALEAVSNAAELTSVDRFESADLASFGLDTPQFTLYVETADGAFYVHVGDQNAFNRTYLAVQSADVTPFALEVTAEPEAATTEAAPETTPDAAATVEVTPEVTVEPVTLAGTQTVYTIIAASIDTLTQLVATPPYVPAPTATPTGTNTPNPFSEVDMTATAQAVFDQLVQTATAAAQPPAVTAEVTPDAPAEVTPDATAEVTAEVTLDATAEVTPTLEPTARPTGRVVIPTREATTAPTLTPTVTPTLEPTARPTGRVIIPTREATTAP